MAITEKLFNKGRSIFYIIGEINGDIKGTNEWFKIGKAQESKKEDPLSERIRAMNQGNPRGVESKHIWSGYTDFICIVEKDIISSLKNLGYRSRFSVTEATGHSEWFEIPLSDLIRICNQRWEWCLQVYNNAHNSKYGYKSIEGIFE